jgi:ATP-dependent exoDNAse (exonuclease V) beta subunit
LALSAVSEVLGFSPGATLWREKRFEVILDGEWVTGTFDRVIIWPDRVLIVDFKTDAVADEAAARARAEGYRPQLALYRRVASCLTGLGLESIRCVLVFSRPGVVVAAG